MPAMPGLGHLARPLLALRRDRDHRPHRAGRPATPPPRPSTHRETIAPPEPGHPAIEHHGPNPNTVGRDFVAGDIHGCFRTLEHALERVAFQPDRDRLFAVGDLVNRGPNSRDALEWLESGRITTVRGNHEDHLLRALERGGEHLLGWPRSFAPGASTRWRERLRRPPWALDIETPHGPVGIVHAGTVERSWPVTVAGLERRDPHTLQTATLGQRGKCWRGRPGSGVDGLHALITGHYPRRNPLRDGSWWLIDTGAGFQHLDRLTILQIDCDPMEPTTVDVDRTERQRAPGA